MGTLLNLYDTLGMNIEAVVRGIISLICIYILNDQVGLTKISKITMTIIAILFLLWSIKPALDVLIPIFKELKVKK